MPSSVTILETLSSMAEDLVWLAVAWHAVMLTAVGLRVMGLRVSPHASMLALTLPSVSVSVAAFGYGLAFNGVAFGVLGLAFATLGILSKHPSLQHGPRWAGVLGAALLVFGWVYPHFNSGPWHRTLYAAPLGVLPCPTLAMLAGTVLWAESFRSRAACSLLALWCAFYAAFGVFRLGVVIDLGLLFGAVGLTAVAACRHPRRSLPAAGRARLTVCPVHARPEPSVNGPSTAQASKRSRFITFVQAATKSFTNFSCASALPYTSEIARSTECEPKTRSARVPVHFT